jgi:C1A family cysteine protease
MPQDKVNVSQLNSLIKAANAEWVAGKTSVSELTAEQRKKLLGYVPGAGEESLDQRIHASAAKISAIKSAVGAPAAFDWRNANGHNYITPVKDQKHCGSCVAFGTTAAVEGTFRVQSGNPNLAIDLSEASLFFCIGPGAGAGACPDGGWYMTPAMDGYKNIGVPDDACYPYTDQNQACHQCSDWQTRAVKITGWHTVGSAADIKSWLSTRGPLATCFTVYDDFFAYTSGVYRHVSGGVAGGHCVCVVGYSDAGGFWICKNSWGTGWGESGFFCIAYGECGIDSTMWAVEGVQTGVTYSGVWRAGSDAHYLWVNASWSNFNAKWQQLSAQNLRLVDLKSYRVGGNRLWAGVWRAGSDAHYLWVNANWANFVAKWQQLSAQNLRLTVLTTYEEGGTRLYAGVWRAGSDAYYLWANASWDNFKAKWQQLSAQNLRLIDLEIWIPGTMQQAGAPESGQAMLGKGDESEPASAAVGEGGGGAVPEAGIGEGGGSEEAEVGAGEGGGSEVPEASIGEVGAGEGGGSEAPEAGMGQGGGGS